MKLTFSVLSCLAVALCSARATVTPASLFTDNAVLQQGMPVPVWGKADPGEKVTVTYQGKSETAVTDAGGHWKAVLPAFKTDLSGPLVIAGSNTITLNNVVTGEVWLCSGQSNMGFLVRMANNAAAEIAAASYPKIRYFMVRPNIIDQPVETVTGKWVECNPNNVPVFSAVAYFFARNLFQSLKVPVGIINSADGGTLVETWTSTDVMKKNPRLSVVLDRWAAELKFYPQRKVTYDAALVKWNEAVKAANAANPPGKPDPHLKPQLPPGPGANDTPGGHFNGMIHPLIPYAIRGMVWYQGESNAPRASEYRELCKAMILDWRARWGQGSFPVLIVELPRHLRPSDKTHLTWAYLREAQTQLLAIDNTGLVITLDLGETLNLHPTNKQDVGYRVALLARGLVYGQPIVFSGPLFQDIKIKNSSADITFKYTGKGLSGRGGQPLAGFEIAGADKVFVPADAKVEGNTVVVSSPKIMNPVAVRYAWLNDPVAANLVNSEGLPASPFRTDTW